MKYKVYSDMTGNKPIFVTNNEEEAQNFCYSQNKNLYPKEVMIYSPMYCYYKYE